MNCTYCNAKILFIAQRGHFCSECDSQFCSRCKDPLERGANYCANCGAIIKYKIGINVKRLTLTLPDPLASRLRKLSKETEMTMVEIIRRALEAYFAELSRKEENSD